MKWVKLLSVLGLGVLIGYLFFGVPADRTDENKPNIEPNPAGEQSSTLQNKEEMTANEGNENTSEVDTTDVEDEKPLPSVSEIRNVFRQKLRYDKMEKQIEEWCALGKEIVPVLCKADAAESDGPVYDRHVNAFAKQLGPAAADGFATYILEVVKSGERRQVDVPMPDNTTEKREVWFAPEMDDRTSQVVELSYRQLAKAETISPEIIEAIRLGMWHKNADWRCAALNAAGLLGEKVKGDIASVLLDPAYEHRYRVIGWRGGESAACTFAKWRLEIEPEKNLEQLFTFAAEPDNSAECGFSLLCLAQYNENDARLPKLLLAALENPTTDSSAARGIAIMGVKMTPFREQIAQAAKKATGVDAHWLKYALKEIDSKTPKGDTKPLKENAEVF